MTGKMFSVVTPILPLTSAMILNFYCLQKTVLSLSDSTVSRVKLYSKRGFMTIWQDYNEVSYDCDPDLE